MRLAVHKLKARSASKAHLRKASVQRTIERAWLRTGGKTVQFYSSLDSGGTSPGVTVDHSGVGGAVSSSSTVTVTTRTATVSVNGGVAPFTYAWTQTSGDTMAATNPSGASTAFSASLAPGAIFSAVWRCTVTDAAGTTGTVDVTATLSNRGGTL